MSLDKDKKLIMDFLETYKFLPCLWDPKDNLYKSKSARNRAYELLTEKYKPVNEDATVDLIKKRLKNMKMAYKRAHKKVLASRVHGNGPEDEYQPALWYYKYLRFLDEDDDNVITTERITEYRSDDDSKKNIYTGLPKKRNRHSNGGAYCDVVIVKRDQDYFKEESEPGPVENNIHNESFNLCQDETESFGRTVGLQLKRIDSLQRNIAEKLISDVIYYARLNQLNTRTTININENFVE